MIVHGGKVEPGQHFRFKPSRGSGTYEVTRVRGERVTLQDVLGMRRPKTISFKTLRGDYERAP